MPGLLETLLLQKERKALPDRTIYQRLLWHMAYLPPEVHDLRCSIIYALLGLRFLAIDLEHFGCRSSTQTLCEEECRHCLPLKPNLSVSSSVISWVRMPE